METPYDNNRLNNPRCVKSLGATEKNWHFGNTTASVGTGVAYFYTRGDKKYSFFNTTYYPISITKLESPLPVSMSYTSITPGNVIRKKPPII